ncbi:hypothetical protein C3U77_003687 [Escherichia coli]|uniref:hypothetical protein n=1 Tax=Escherichia coli TaxID=562 RepID=UPI0005AA4A07|nr:hypothetical protein [Escherichia coli]EED1396316.1 hypothetical protein [Escherichia coli]EEQ4615915.1 hypothetical protein [Escherichia coli]EEQ7469445.1 hypothetical protein [Escherichia coli]EEQ8094528.1 hypothetical protein [Escherichia coli]EER5394253.1 hypothetical protein [Escherichia coli]
MNISELISVLSQVSRELETAAVDHGSLTDISREAAQLQEQLCRGKQVTPAQLRALNARLWGIRMRLVAQYGRRAGLIHTLETQSSILENAVNILNNRWRYREWVSSSTSFIPPTVFIIPLLSVLCYMMKSGSTGGVELCTALAGTCFAGQSLFALWAKDPVWLFWSLYSFIPLYFLWY